MQSGSVFDFCCISHRAHFFSSWKYFPSFENICTQCIVPSGGWLICHEKNSSNKVVTLMLELWIFCRTRLSILTQLFLGNLLHSRNAFFNIASQSGIRNHYLSEVSDIIALGLASSRWTRRIELFHKIAFGYFVRLRNCQTNDQIQNLWKILAYLLFDVALGI